MTKEVKLLICTPCCRDIKPQFYTSMLALQNRLITEELNPPNTLASFNILTQHQASCVSEARNDFFDVADKIFATHLLMIDDDMSFAPNVIDYLIDADKDVIAVNARKKSPERKYCAVNNFGIQLDSSKLFGTEKVMTVGCGIILIKIDAVRKIKKPYFKVDWDEAKQQYITEDVYFSNLCNKNNIDVYCSHDASKLVGHVGDFEYRF